MSDDPPSEVFRAYLSALAVDGQSAHIAERWTGVQEWRSRTTKAEIPFLIAAAWGEVDEQTRSGVQPLLTQLTEADETFNTIGAPAALRTLAAAALDNVFTYSPRLDVPACLAILTASWGNRAPTELRVDIVERAKAENDRIAGLRRARADLIAPLAKLAAAQLPLTSASLSLIKDGNEDSATISGAFDETLKAVNKALTSQAASIRAQLEPFAKRIALCDEESDVLWLVISNTSSGAGAPYSTLNPCRAAFFAACEIAEITTAPLRTDNAEELFRRCNAIGDACRVADAVELMDVEWIRATIAKDLSPRMFPLHKALDRYAYLGDAGTWVAGWAKETGIAPDLAIDPTELALQFYRERLLVKGLT